MYDLRSGSRIRLGPALLSVGICLAVGILGIFFQRELASALIYLETGRTPQSALQQPTQPEQTEPSPTQTVSAPSEPEGLTFTEEDLTYVSVQYQCGYRPDLAALMTQPLALALAGQEPTVLILHSHGTEAYAGADYDGDYRTLDDSQNMIAIGDEVARILESSGIRVIHDRTPYDHPDYNGAYAAARAAIAGYLAEYPGIALVLDLHRDASDSTQGQLVTSATVGGQSAAQLMMVVGTDESGNYHPYWQENLALALKLSALLEQTNPGICRPIDLRSQRFNMDLSADGLIVEVGAAGNTYEEARIAAHALAQAIIALAEGANLS